MAEFEFLTIIDQVFGDPGNEQEQA